MGNQKDYMKKYCAEHKNKIYSTVVKWRKENREHVHELQRIYNAKTRAWKKIIKEFNNILLDGY
jgi:hypothetical protein